MADALAEARGLRVSFVLAHQYLGQLSAEMREAIDANARNKIYFSLAPGDAADLADHVKPWLDAGDLTRLGGFEVVLRPIANARPVPPCTLATLPPPEPQPDRSGFLRAAAAARTGLPTAKRTELAARHAIHESAQDGDQSEFRPPTETPSAPLGPVLYPPGTGTHQYDPDHDAFEEAPWTTPWP